MTTRPFIAFRLRTPWVDEARDFYGDLIGARPDCIVRLPEAAQRRGAPSHWLGLIAVDEPMAAVETIERRRGQVLGPRPAPNGTVVVRDPGHALFALVPLTDQTASPAIGWCLLHSYLPPEDAMQNYCDWFDWAPTGAMTVSPFGHYEGVTWAPDGRPTGAIGDLVGRKGVHPHWLPFFIVRRLDEALDALKVPGASTHGAVKLPDGSTVAVCEDPWGAAFGLMASGR